MENTTIQQEKQIMHNRMICAVYEGRYDEAKQIASVLGISSAEVDEMIRGCCE